MCVPWRTQIGCFELLKGLLEHIVEEVRVQSSRPASCIPVVAHTAHGYGQLWNVRFDSKAAETRHALPRIEKVGAAMMTVWLKLVG
eukprot:scaffold1387_cov382-Prasinococcus_capsulatus_cf.AAC.5